MAALNALGFSVQRQSWSDAGVDWSRYQAVLFRSTWDYFERLDEFLPWLERVAGQTQVFNEAALIRWNADKRYLADLATAGMTIVPTRFVSRGSTISLAQVVAEAGWDEVVFKPVVSGAGRHTYRVGNDELAAHEDIFARCLGAEDMMVQPFEAAVVESGELSVVVIDGRAGHAIRKTPRAGEFRVQDDHGGTVHPHQPSPGECDFAEAVVAACPLPPLYARVDFIRHRNGEYRLMELELIEPELFFRLAPEAAMSFARALKWRCG